MWAFKFYLILYPSESTCMSQHHAWVSHMHMCVGIFFPSSVFILCCHFANLKSVYFVLSFTQNMFHEFSTSHFHYQNQVLPLTIIDL